MPQYTVELLPAHQDGLANLVSRYQVDARPDTLAAYAGYPHLSAVMRPVNGVSSNLHRKEPGEHSGSVEIEEDTQRHGMIDPYPEFVHATLPILDPPVCKDPDALIKRICNQHVATLANQDFIQ